MLLTEIFKNNTIPYEVEESSDAGEWLATATLGDGREYIFSAAFESSDIGSGVVKIAFSINRGYKVTADKSGNGIEAFSLTMDIMKRFIDEKSPDVISFSADMDHIKLYNAMVRRFKEGYKTYIDKSNYSTKFFMFKDSSDVEIPFSLYGNSEDGVEVVMGAGESKVDLLYSNDNQQIIYFNTDLAKFVVEASDKYVLDNLSDNVNSLAEDVFTVEDENIAQSIKHYMPSLNVFSDSDIEVHADEDSWSGSYGLVKLSCARIITHGAKFSWVAYTAEGDIMNEDSSERAIFSKILEKFITDTNAGYIFFDKSKVSDETFTDEMINDSKWTAEDYYIGDGFIVYHRGKASMEINETGDDNHKLVNFICPNFSYTVELYKRDDGRHLKLINVAKGVIGEGIEEVESEIHYETKEVQRLIRAWAGDDELIYKSDTVIDFDEVSNAFSGLDLVEG